MKSSAAVAILILVLSFCSNTRVFAHCDTLDGPVVADARQALQKGDVTPVLKWVNVAGEKEIRETFALTVKVRSQGEDARKLADLHFFETLVRVHRAGEGVPYAGLKPAGTIDPAVKAADQALQEGVVDKLAAEIAGAVREGIQKRFAEVIEKKRHAEDSVAAGRAYVAAYVQYVHFVEALDTLAARGAEERDDLHTSAEASH